MVRRVESPLSLGRLNLRAPLGRAFPNEKEVCMGLAGFWRDVGPSRLRFLLVVAVVGCLASACGGGPDGSAAPHPDSREDLAAAPDAPDAPDALDAARAPSSVPLFAVVPGSTRKICQLTGEFDRHAAATDGVPPEDRPAHNRTFSRYGIHGTDLGSSFEQGGVLWFLFGDTFATETIPFDPEDGQSHSRPNPIAADAIAFTTDTDPTDCVDLEFLTRDDADDVWRCPSFDPGGSVVQGEGLGLGGSMYVWFADGEGPSVTRLARSDDGGRRFSVLHDVSTNRFLGVSVEIVPALLLPGLEDVGTADWIFVFGTGPTYRESDLFLAVVPVASIEDPNGMAYFAGRDAEGLPRWSPSEDVAVPVIDVDNPLATGDYFLGVPLDEKRDAEGCIGEFSVHYNEQAEAWVVLYNCDFTSIEMHTAEVPWGPWSEAVTVFHPVDDGGYCNFLHLTAEFAAAAGLDCARNVSVPGRADPGSPYGPFVIERYTTGTPGSVTLYFTMSMWHPYNVLLMTTELRRR